MSLVAELRSWGGKGFVPVNRPVPQPNVDRRHRKKPPNSLGTPGRSSSDAVDGSKTVSSIFNKMRMFRTFFFTKIKVKIITIMLIMRASPLF